MNRSHELEAEWTRLELLSRSLMAARAGREPDQRLLDDLVAAQAAVSARRAAGAWTGTARVALDNLESDLLAAALAPEAQPSVGWLFSQLHGAAPQPYATPALIADLHLLDGGETRALYERLAEAGTLRLAGLIEPLDDGPYSPLRPTALARGLVLGWSATAAPPGARPVREQAGWEDLVLPPDRLAVLREYVAMIRHRGVVHREWGGRVPGGPLALFCGASGTGKTFAAAVIASELGWPLYRVDLGRLVSKYIGETEKNLNRLFEAAHGRPLLLQFDEADSLFGKRAEVRDARDRYANLEVSHLLARIEQHEGPCILTTNMRRQLDGAFTRRFQVVVEFPRPDAAARAAIWSRVLPPRAPRHPDLDERALAGVAMTGGAIHNAAIHAAFLAAEAGGAIGPREAAIAIWRELGKDGLDVNLGALGEMVQHLPAGLAGELEVAPA
jgi:hypothetical protein